MQLKTTRHNFTPPQTTGNQYLQTKWKLAKENGNHRQNQHDYTSCTDLLQITVCAEI